MSREKRMMNRKKSNTRNNKEIEIENRIIKDEVTNIVSNKKLLITMVVTVLVLVTLLSSSFAMFMRSGESEKKDLYQSGTLVIDFDDENGEVIDLNPTKPMTDEYAIRTLKPYTFKITNTGTTNASYEVKLNETIENNILSNEEVRKYIRYQIDDESPRSLYGQGSNIIVRGGIGPQDTLEFKLKLWVDIDAPNDMEGTTYKAIVSASGKSTNRMQPNGPELVDGLIPVVYDEKTENWVKADTSTTWYNYEKQKWANAVTVTIDKRETYLSNEAGTPINMEDINTMWVWIPRYKYRIPESIGMGTTENPILNPPEIDVIFESRYNATGKSEAEYRDAITSEGTLDETDGEKIYYTHPTFRDGTNKDNYKETSYDIGGWNKELTGIWVAKFSTGGTAEEPVIKPNMKTIGSQDLNTQFLTSLKISNGQMNTNTGNVTMEIKENNIYGINTKNNTADTHMTKNTEWGAVAYLSQSRYGKMGNNNYEGTNKEIYKNDSNSYYTGRSIGYSPPPVDATASGTYSYDGIICKDVNCTKGEKTDESKLAGYGASTTGTIYGIYDTSGGSYFRVMANLNNMTSGTGFTKFPNSQYMDTYNKSNLKDIAILGDASWETGGWYSDTLSDLWQNPCLNRGGWANYGSDSGIFRLVIGSGNTCGSNNEDCTFKITLIP